MSVITGVTRGGEEYIPEFVDDIEQKNCIGCGRCFNVCPRNVFDLVERTSVANDEDDYDEYGDDDDDSFSDDTSMVMSINDGMDCIGCGSCARICPKKCFTHKAQSVT